MLLIMFKPTSSLNIVGRRRGCGNFPRMLLKASPAGSTPRMILITRSVRKAFSANLVAKRLGLENTTFMNIAAASSNELENSHPLDSISIKRDVSIQYFLAPLVARAEKGNGEISAPL
jgi:hypothetical protein